MHGIQECICACIPIKNTVGYIQIWTPQKNAYLYVSACMRVECIRYTCTYAHDTAHRRLWYIHIQADTSWYSFVYMTCARVISDMHSSVSCAYACAYLYVYFFFRYIQDIAVHIRVVSVWIFGRYAQAGSLMKVRQCIQKCADPWPAQAGPGRAQPRLQRQGAAHWASKNLKMGNQSSVLNEPKNNIYNRPWLINCAIFYIYSTYSQEF